MGSSVWSEALFQPPEPERRNCTRCGHTIAVTGDDVGLCGRCASLVLGGRPELARPPAPAPQPEMVKMGTFSGLCEAARSFSNDPKLRAEKAHLHLWEEDAHIGFQLISPFRPKPVIHYVIKWTDGTVDGVIELRNKLYEALGQPEKIVRKKSVWDWLRKPAV